MNATFPPKMATAKIATVNTSHLDECECGDYRQNHENSVGACRLNGLGHGQGSATAGECHKFRLARRYDGQH